MIIHKYKFIFVHIPRTGGTSIETAFGYGFGNPVPEQKHNIVRHYLGHKSFKIAVEKKYKIFTFIRNPWTRIISYYRWVHSFQGAAHPLYTYASGTFEAFVASLPFIIKYVGMVRPQSEFVINTKNEIAVNYIGRYENYLEDWKIISKELGVPNVSLPHVLNTKESENKSLEEYYKSLAIRNLIGEVYQSDLDMFGYTFGSKSTKNNLKTMYPKLKVK